MARSPLALSALTSAVALLALTGTATPAQAGLDISINLNFGLGFDWCEPAPCHAAPVWDGWVDDAFCEPAYIAPVTSWCAPVTRVETYTSYDRWGSTYRYESYTYGSAYRGWNRWRGWDDCDDWRWSRPYGYRSGWSLGYSSGWCGSGFSFSYSSRPSYGYGWGSRHWSRPAFYCPPPVVIYQPVVVQPVVVHRPVVINQTPVVINNTPVVINNNPVVINNNPPIIRGSDRDRGGFVGPIAQSGASGQVVEVSTSGGNGIGVDGSLPNGMDRRGNAKPNRAVAQPTVGPVAKPVDPRPIQVKPIEAKTPVEAGRRPIGKPGRNGNVIDDRGNLVGPIAKPSSRDEAKPDAQPQRQPEVVKPLPSVFDKPQEVRPVQQVKPVEQVRPIETGKPGTIRRPIRGGDFNVINRPAADNTAKPALPNGVREIKPVEPQAVPQPQQVKPMPSVFDKPQEMPAAKPIVRTRDRQAQPQRQVQQPMPQPQKWPERFEQVGPRGDKPAMPQAPVDAGKPIRRAVPQPAVIQPQVKPFVQPQPEPSKPIAQPGGKDKRDSK